MIKLKFNKKKLFLFIMLLSTIMAISSSKWLSAWLAMEINLMNTIPFIYETKNKKMSEKIMIYFLTQVMASVLMLTTILTLSNFDINMFSKLILSASMMIKLGMPPFHMWMPEMLNKLNWNVTLIMLTIQKINPLFILNQLIEQNMILTIMMIMSSTLGSIMGINQLSLNKIMAFSSMNHMSWMIMCMMNSSNLWMKYFLIYFIINLTLCIFFNENKLFYINQMNMKMNFSLKMTTMLMMLNLGGLPPLPGFYLKWMSIESMMNFDYLYMILLIMLLSSMVTLLFYMRLMIMSALLSTTTQKFNKILINKKYYLIMMTNMIMPMFILN
uniref:NADH-ubiquinone oxidoreductase chain 2 n=1 Tax=Pseudacysta perseae TaxID=1041453 RepID=A0A089QJI1_PSEPZ|nr:NADH dehydrogenase subunit 2 [Pseudacysta perseae]AIR11941.1 NADH dehydrogenase subunit 2 [Pseudacysta perseae]